MKSPASGKQLPYHHGDLRRALVQAGTELAREGGPSAIVLREAARRVGVSPNAAYRHFTAWADLVQAVAFEALAALARSMEAELGKWVPTGDAGRDAINRLEAVGRGYIHFALREPGLFATAFAPPRWTTNTERAVPQPVDAQADPASGALGVGDSGLMAYELLEQALDTMVDAGVLDGSDREIATTNAWGGVHGLSMLLLGPMAEVEPDAREALIDAYLDLICRGLVRREHT